MNTPITQVEKGRLIVLMPECLISNIELVNTIYQTAKAERREVFYVALVEGSAKMLAATRSLATLKALVGGGQVSSGSRVVEASRWMEALREIYRPGDVILCNAEQQVRSGFLRTVPAHEVVRERLNAPVQTVSGFYHPMRLQIGQFLRGLAYWAGLLVIIGSFFFLEIQLDQGLHGAARNVLLAFLLLATLAAGWIWNKIGNS